MDGDKRQRVSGCIATIAPKKPTTHMTIMNARKLKYHATTKRDIQRYFVEQLAETYEQESIHIVA